MNFQDYRFDFCYIFLRVWCGVAAIRLITFDQSYMHLNRKFSGFVERNAKGNISAENGKHFIQEGPDSSQIESFMNEEESEGEPAFDTKNYLFQLQSRCNSLEYQKTKMVMAHQNIVSELRHKKDFYEQLSGNLQLENQQIGEEAERVKQVLGEVQEQNIEFSKEVNLLKMELERLHRAQMESQSGNEGEGDRQGVGAKLIQKIREVESKDQEIVRLERELSRCNSQQRDSRIKVESPLNHRQTLSRVEKERNGLVEKLEEANQQITDLEQRQRELIKAAGEQQSLSRQIQEKQGVLARLERQNAALRLQVDKLKEGPQLADNRNGLAHAEQVRRMKEMMASKEQQLLQTENEVIALENRVGELQVEMHRLKCQKNGVEQYNKYLQKNNAQNQEKRKNMQQEIYVSERRISQLRALIFNEKLSTQKTINNLKLQFEEEKIRNIDEIEEKSKEIYRLKQILLSNKRENKDVEQVNAKVRAFQKLTQQNQVLKSQNQAFRQKLKALEQKQQKMQVQLSLEERRIRSELEKRVESLEKEIQKLKTENLQFQNWKQYGNYPASLSQPSRSSHLIEALSLSRADKREKEELIRMFTTTIKEKEQDCLQHNETIRSLNAELREMKDQLLRNSVNQEKLEEKNRVIWEMENGLARVNDELRREKVNGERNQKDLMALQHKYDQDVEQCEEKCKRLKRQISDLTIRLTHLESEIVKKDTLIAVKEGEVRELAKGMREELLQNETLKSREDHLQRTIAERQRAIEQLRKDKEKVGEELKRQLKLTSELRLQKQQKASAKPSSKNEEGQTATINHLKQMMGKLQKQNYALRSDYSESLSQVNHLLIKYRTLEQQFKRKHYHEDRMRQQSNDIQVANMRSQQLQRQNQQSKLMISNYEIQIKRLNQILMQKQMGLTRQQSHSAFLHPKIFPRYLEEKGERKERSFFLRKKTEQEKKAELLTERTAKSFHLNNK